METLAQIATIITGFGVMFAVWQLREAKIQRIRQFEDFYIQRYWTLMDELSLPALKSMLLNPGALTDAVFAGLSNSDQRAAYAYLVLCEDEAELRRVGWVSDKTWTLWREYIASQLSRSPFAEAWAEVTDLAGEAKSFEHLHEMTTAQSGGQLGMFDPVELDRFRRWMRGLR